MTETDSKIERMARRAMELIANPDIGRRYDSRDVNDFNAEVDKKLKAAPSLKPSIGPAFEEVAELQMR